MLNPLELTDGYGKPFIYKHRTDNGTICECGTWFVVIPFETALPVDSWETALGLLEILYTAR